MLPEQEFDNYTPAQDEYANEAAQLRLDDLQPAWNGKPKISYLISTYNRQWQLARSLETLARQTFKEFEVLIMDDGSTQDIPAILDLFRPFLKVRSFRRERATWVSCPSQAFKIMIPETRGEIIAIAHPEMMLDYQALDVIWRGCNGQLTEDEALYWTIGDALADGKKYWVSLKPQFLDDLYHAIDTVDWHTDLRNFQKLSGYWQAKGFASFENSWHAQKDDYPWWFVGAAKKDCKIWSNLPTYKGHGIIDMWLCSYRRQNGYTDICPRQPLCYHQPHLRTAVGTQEEKHDRTRFAKRVE